MAKFRLDEVCSSVIDCEHKTVPEDLYGSAWAVGTAAMSDGRIDFSRAKRISDDTYDSWTRRAIPVEGDLILAREAPVGPVVRVPASPRVALGQRTVLLRPRPDLIDSRYLHFLLMSSDMQHLMHSKSEGSTVRHLNVEDVRALPLPPLPPLAEQRGIAGLLGALDDKIKSNRQRAELLDAILLYEYLLLLKRDDAKTVPLETLVKPALGGVWGSDNATEKEQLKVSCFRGVDLASIARTDWPKPPTRWIREGQFAPRKFGSGEIWLEGSGSFCGRSLLISESIQQLFDEPVCYSNFVKRVVPVSDPRLSVVSWLALRHAYNIGEVAQSRIGSAFPNLDLGALLANTQVLVPNDSDLNRLCGLTENRLDTQVLRENRTLSELRDTLLPELLSGRLRVKGAESMMENV